MIWRSQNFRSLALIPGSGSANNECLPAFMELLEGRYFKSLNREDFSVGVYHKFMTERLSLNK